MTVEADLRLTPSEQRNERVYSLGQIALAASSLVSLLLCTVVGIVLIINARMAVEEEVRSAFELAHATISSRMSVSYGGSTTMSAAIRIAEEIDAQRHVAAEVVDARGNRLTGPTESATAETAPGWFVALMSRPEYEASFAITNYPNILGTIRLIADPSDEIAEVWEDFRVILPAVALTGIAIILLGIVLTRIMLRSFGLVQAAMGEMQAGRLDVRAPGSRLAEVSALAAGVNALARHLEIQRDENKLLHARLLTLSEAERARIASDLHDEMGPELFALNAATGQAKLAARRVAGDGAEQLCDALEAIHRHAEAVQKRARTAISDLRPMLVGEAPLAELLEELVAGFKEMAPTVTFCFRADSAIATNEMAELSIYRFVRESILNSLRHGEADHVDVRIWREGTTIVTRIADTGRGPSAGNCSPRLGQIGMQDRASALGAIYLPPWREQGRTITELRMPDQ